MVSSITQRVLLIRVGFSCAVLIFVWVSVLGWWNIHSLLNASRNNHSTYQFLRHLDALVGHLVEAETAQRGYLLSFDRTYLVSYHSSLGLFKDQLTQLQVVAHREGLQEDLLLNLFSMAEEKLVELEASIQWFQLSDANSDALWVSMDRGKELMQGIRTFVDEMRSMELQRLTLRDQRALGQALIGSRSILAGGILGALLLLWAVVQMIHDLKRRSAAEAALRLAQSDLERRVLIRTAELAEAKEAAVEADRTKGRFLAVMSHEIRTPMNSIIGFAELLDESPLTTEQREWLRAVRSSGESLLHLINDILDFSKFEAGKEELESQPVNIRDVIQHVLDTALLKDGAERLKLVSDIADDVPLLFLGDSTRLRQILVNLVGNAVKFTKHGHVKVVVKREGVLRDNGSLGLYFAVEDTGIGIAKHHIGALFQPFHQVNSSNTRKYGGTGLGLAICSRLVELMGGVITVTSQLGKGTSFSFALTVTACATVPRNNDAVPAKMGGRTVGMNDLDGNSTFAQQYPCRILVAEDQLLNQRLIGKMLEKLGYSPALVSNGKECLEYWRIHRPDVILMDVQMPVMDGLQAAAQLRKEENESSFGQKTWIFALTANALPKDREACLAAGMDGYLAKPIHKNDLSEILRQTRPPISVGRS